MAHSTCRWGRARQRSGGANGIKGTVASADFGSGVATGVRETDGGVARACRPQVSARRRSRRTRRTCSAWIAVRRPHRSRSHSSESGLYGRGAKSEIGRRSSAGSAVRGERQLRVNRVCAVSAMDLTKPQSPPPTRCVSSQPRRVGRRWIRLQLCTWYFNSRTKTIGDNGHAEVYEQHDEHHELDHSGSAGSIHCGSGQQPAPAPQNPQPVAAAPAAPAAPTSDAQSSSAQPAQAQAPLAPPTTMDQWLTASSFAKKNG